MVNFWTKAFSVFVLSTCTVGETIIQQRRIRRGTKSGEKADTDARELEFVRNPLRGSNKVPEKFLRSLVDQSAARANTDQNGSTHRKAQSRTDLIRKQIKAANNRMKLFKKRPKARFKLNLQIELPMYKERDQGILPVPIVPVRPPTVPPVSATPTVSSTTTSSTPSAQPSSAPTIYLSPSINPSTNPSINPSITDLDEATLSNVTDGRLSDSTNADSNRDRLGSPTRGNRTELDNSDDSDSEVATVNDTTGRIIDEESREDQKIGGPTRSSDRDDFFSEVVDSTSLSDTKIDARNETTGRVSDETSREDLKIGSPTRSMDRDDPSTDLADSESVSESEITSSNEFTGRVSDETSKEDRKIGTPSTDRDQWVSNVANMGLVSDVDAASANEFTSRYIDQTSKDDKKIGGVTTNRVNQVSNLEDLAFGV